ncbi:PTS transporter subunit IIC [Staphylococcus simiae]|uniref:PTS transporter subunit IIC n=1 Tax=Staphylococcus simiae TaxID=308354 RepID=UPI001A96DE99|nr:PTS transporter subunit IIC [Staphylococcus simiae]MBO1199176.1 PTS transporter subunit IIC [Staphylococcus simiae]MBO1201421.1 PTS transporter subunit IIC [Staphylococcus simiae]MBO1203525.1 PTS transporter subunit IIC [Staphylococcus simiae]MBO1211148.1 PTS transporter subunit IIC [Staphylococcus simiae]MBO1229715.1 PTS transporter subunit IIC [Staphylococcus simiae]
MSNSKTNNNQFFSKILNAVGAGVVIALIPNALLGELLKIFKNGNEILEMIYQLVIIIQSFMAFIVGILAAHQLKFNGAGAAIIGTSAILGSGAIIFNGQGFEIKGIGDIINTIIVVIIACLIYMLLQNKLGSFEMIILPVLIPIVSGGIGLITLPYVRQITQALGRLINSFTDLNPLLMSILISVTFSLLMVTPISLVAIATAISLNGLGSGAANLGIVAACVTFLFGSLRVNSIGVNMVLLIGAAKMMIPVFLKNLIIAIPLTINGIIVGIIAYVLQVKGTPLSAGFGYTGLVGPINAYNRMPGDPTMNIILLAIGYFIIPFISGFIVHELCKKFIPLYSNDIYKFEVPKQ